VVSVEQRYAAVSTMTGFEVIDTLTGHPQGFECDSRRQANAYAQMLNQAAAATVWWAGRTAEYEARA
jgi:hypothetical protein